MLRCFRELLWKHKIVITFSAQQVSKLFKNVSDLKLAIAAYLLISSYYNMC